jgi:LysR family glycine cleavage system transcriptional activator
MDDLQSFISKVMRRKLPPLGALRAFEATARHLSFTVAGDELGVTQGAVSRQVKALESHLGLRLFRRMTRAIALTDEGRGYFNTLGGAFDRIEAATADAMRQNVRGVLTINVLPSFAMRWLIPRLPDFTAVEPNIEVRMVTSIDPVSFAREEIDLAIRVGRPKGEKTNGKGARINLVMTDDWRQVAIERLVPDIPVPVCSPSLITPERPLRRVEDLRNFTLLHNATRPHAWEDWLRSVGHPDFDPARRHSYGHFFMCLQAAAEGRGVALAPHVLIESDIRSRSLIAPVAATPPSASAHYYLLGRRHAWNSVKVKRFRHWLRRQARGDAHAWLKPSTPGLKASADE